MASLSEKLRRERELRGISLKQISDDTRIRVRFLEALEEGRLERIPGEFYRRSYLRAYARYLELDEDRAVNTYIFSQNERPTPETDERVFVPGLKVIGALLPFFIGVYRDWQQRYGRSAWKLAKRQAIPAAVVAVAVAALVADHITQNAAVAVARADAAEARLALHRLEESAAEGRRSQQRLEYSAAEDRQALQRIEEVSAEVIAFMRESDPDLSESEALERVVEELLQLRQAAGLEDLGGLRRYRYMAKLDIHGEAIDAISTDAFPTPLMQALEGAWIEEGLHIPRCDDASLTKFAAVAQNTPRFPFSHFALAVCAKRSGGEADIHAERAWEILRHTTQIPERHRHHELVYAIIQREFSKLSHEPTQLESRRPLEPSPHGRRTWPSRATHPKVSLISEDPGAISR